MNSLPYRGRFAPSPTGLLHQGSLVAAMASYLDARAHEGTWLIRIEDIDPPRLFPGAPEHILATLAKLKLFSDEPIVFQSTRTDYYESVLSELQKRGLIYRCACSRKAAQLRAIELGLAPEVYPGTCRDKHLEGPFALRFKVNHETIAFNDRWLGPYTQNVAESVGDFVVRRADQLWAYQLAVVADDIAADITDIVRGADLIDNTPRQIMLYRALGLSEPRYMHLPLVLNDLGEKLSKQAGATPLDENNLLGALELAWSHLGFPRIGADNIDAFWVRAIDLWKTRFIDSF